MSTAEQPLVFEELIDLLAENADAERVLIVHGG